ncbi:MAG TPA: cytochrome c [Bdellovibrionales bacterium]|nr:cytochrome c [Bdellovibrionales bacterium]
MQQKEYNKGGLYLFLFGTGFVLLFFIYLSFIHPHGSPDYKAPAPAAAKESETSPPAAADAAGGATAPAQGDPWVSSPDRIAKGEALFQTNCAVCHGPKGGGDGVTAKSLNPPPRNMVEGKWKFGGSPFQLFDLITKGSPGTSMAAFGHLPEDDRWALVHFVQSVTKNLVPATDKEIETYKGSKK